MTLGLTPSVVQMGEAEKCDVVITGTQTHLNCILTFCRALFFPAAHDDRIDVDGNKGKFEVFIVLQEFFFSVCSNEEKQQ